MSLSKLLSFGAIVVLIGTTTASSEVSAPSYMTEQMLEDYVTGLRRQLPMTSPDGITIKSASRTGRTLVYGMHARNDFSQDAAKLLFDSPKYKRQLCSQEAEAFMLKRKVNLTWNYFDNSGKHLATATITPSDCGF